MTTQELETFREKACDVDGCSYVEVMHRASLALNYAQSSMRAANMAMRDGDMEAYSTHVAKAEECTQFAADMLRCRRHAR